MGIRYAVLLRIEATGFPTLWALLWGSVKGLGAFRGSELGFRFGVKTLNPARRTKALITKRNL